MTTNAPSMPKKGMRAAGNAAVVWRPDEIVLATARGERARFKRPPAKVTSTVTTKETFADRIAGAIVLDEPPRFAVFMRNGSLQKRVTGNDIDYDAGRFNRWGGSDNYGSKPVT